MNQAWLEQMSRIFTGEPTIWVSTGGSDGGNGSVLFPYKTITKALSMVTADRKTVLVLPGTYVEEEEVIWPTISGVRLMGIDGSCGTVIGADSGEDQVISVTPGVQTDAWSMVIENILIDHSNDGQDGIVFDGADVAQDVGIVLSSIGGHAYDGNDYFFKSTHDGAGQSLSVYIREHNGPIEGIVQFDAKDDNDLLMCTDVYLDGGIYFGTTACTAVLVLDKCHVKHEGVTGGSAETLVKTINCWTVTAGAYALLDTDDLALTNDGETILE
jgi:hypothetical protein